MAHSLSCLSFFILLFNLEQAWANDKKQLVAIEVERGQSLGGIACSVGYYPVWSGQGINRITKYNSRFLKKDNLLIKGDRIYLPFEQVKNNGNLMSIGDNLYRVKSYIQTGCSQFFQNIILINNELVTPKLKLADRQSEQAVEKVESLTVMENQNSDQLYLKSMMKFGGLILKSKDQVRGGQAKITGQNLAGLGLSLGLMPREFPSLRSELSTSFLVKKFRGPKNRKLAENSKIYGEERFELGSYLGSSHLLFLAASIFHHQIPVLWANESTQLWLDRAHIYGGGMTIKLLPLPFMGLNFSGSYGKMADLDSLNADHYYRVQFSHLWGRPEQVVQFGWGVDYHRAYLKLFELEEFEMSALLGIRVF